MLSWLPFQVFVLTLDALRREDNGLVPERLPLMISTCV